MGLIFNARKNAVIVWLPLLCILMLGQIVMAGHSHACEPDEKSQFECEICVNASQNDDPDMSTPDAFHNAKVVGILLASTSNWLTIAVSLKTKARAPPYC